MMYLKYLTLLLLPVVMLASGDAESVEHEGSDIIPRVINFLIFAGILYYLIADKIKDFFKGREEGVAQRLSEVEEKLKAAKLHKEETAQQAKDAEVKAQEIVEASKKEAELLTARINEALSHDKLQLEKSFQDRMEIESNKMKKEVVNEVLEEMFSSDSAKISNEDLLNIIKKKVA